MLKLICFSAVQGLFLAGAQILLKLALMKMDNFSWTWKFFQDLFVNWYLLASGVSAVFATLLWTFILKHNDISLVYPLTSMSYIFGILGGMFIFHEVVPTMRWVGVVFIIIGAVFLTRPA